ncbi:MAG TPA: hypothetical protein VFY39_11135 [Gammaproteobacteria bacterium]|nr:hypothetical protein [Gammaproteobacteria bacterium]
MLRLRDGEPVDARLKERLLAESGGARELERLARVKRELGELPALAPPPEAWARIAAEIAERRASSSRARRRLTRLGAAAALVCGLGLAAFFGAGRDQPVSERGPSVSSPGPSGSNPEPAAAPDSYASLLSESARLEQALAQLHYEPKLMSAGTAGTIAGLEDTIALLDQQLTLAAADKADRSQREALWRERVNVMNALVQVRYAQSEGAGYVYVSSERGGH